MNAFPDLFRKVAKWSVYDFADDPDSDIFPLHNVRVMRAYEMFDIARTGSVRIYNGRNDSGSDYIELFNSVGETQGYSAHSRGHLFDVGFTIGWEDDAGVPFASGDKLLVIYRLELK